MNQRGYVILLGLAVLAGCAAPPALSHDGTPDSGRFYQATLEEEFGRIARQEAPGFAGMDLDVAGRLTVYVTPEGDEAAAVRAAREYLARAGTSASPPEQVGTERVALDADELWQLWSKLHPLEEANAAREVVVDWPRSRVVLVHSHDEARIADFAGRLREGLGLPPEALLVVTPTDAPPGTRLPPPPRYPLTEIPPAVMEDTAFVCPVRPGDDEVHAPEQVVEGALEVVTDRPTVDRPVRIRVELRNSSLRPWVVRSTRSIGFELVIRNAAGDVVGYAPAPIGGYVIAPGESGWIPLCPGQSYRREVVWDARLLSPGRYSVELTLPLAPSRPREPGCTVRGLVSVEVDLAPARPE